MLIHSIKFGTCVHVQSLRFAQSPNYCCLDFQYEETETEQSRAENHLIKLTGALSVHTLQLNAIITCCEAEVYTVRSVCTHIHI